MKDGCFDPEYFKQTLSGCVYYVHHVKEIELHIFMLAF